MTRMTRPDCAVMCNLINTHTHTPNRFSRVIMLKQPKINISFSLKNKKTKKQMPNGWRTIKALVHKIRLHGRRGKGMAESFSREKLRHAPQKEGWEILCELPPVWPRLVRPTNLMSRMNGKKTHTHTHTHTVDTEYSHSWFYYVSTTHYCYYCSIYYTVAYFSRFHEVLSTIDVEYTLPLLS